MSDDVLSKYIPSAGSTSSTGSIVLVALLAASPNVGMLDIYRNAGHNYVPSQRTTGITGVKDGSQWESVLHDYADNSAKSAYHPDARKYEIISGFANRLLEDIHAVPEEFDKIFEEHFWDILA